MMEQYKERKRDLHMMFIDLENAYDQVPRKVHWRCLDAKGIHVVYTRVIDDMYDGAKIRVRTVGEDSEHFSIMMGCTNDLLSPFLFALVMDELMQHF